MSRNAMNAILSASIPKQPGAPIRLALRKGGVDLKKIAIKRRRFRNRRIGILLARQGYVTNHKQLYRPFTKTNSASDDLEVGNAPWIE